jgi:hypothetical protein
MILFPHTAGLAISETNLEPMISTGSEDTGEKKSGIVIKPLINISSRMDSNFYKTASDERKVYTYLLQPGITVGYETPKSSFMADYLLNAHLYGGDSDEDNYMGHTFNMSARTRPFARLLLGIEDSFYMTRDGARADNFSNSVDREKYYVNQLTPMLLYEFGNKFSAGLRYRNTMTGYDDSEFKDSSEHRGMLDLIYNFTPTVAIDLQYQRWQRDYDDPATSDYVSDQLKLIFARQFRNFSFELGAGYQTRRFDDNSLDNLGLFTYRIALEGQYPGLPAPRRSYISFVAERNYNDSGVGDVYFKAHQFTLSAGRLFREKISAKLEGRYRISDYEMQFGGREDDTYSISAGLGYIFNERLSLNAEAGYENRDSNLNQYDYKNTYIMGNVDFRYDPSTR